MPRWLALALVLVLPAPSAPAGAAPPPRTGAAALAIPFVRNDGQTHRDVAFHTRLRGGALFVTRAGELVYALDAADGGEATSLVERARGAGAARVRGERRATIEVAFFHGPDPRRWRSHVPAFDAVALGEVAPGVALTLEAHAGAAEKVFRVAPGADPRRIWMEVKGARGLAAEPDGRLAVETAAGTVRFSRPVAYQVIAGGLREVPVAYRPGLGGYGFTVGDYDRARALVIDPFLSTFLGGTGLEYAYALATRQTPEGPVLYVAGSSDSIVAFPGATQPGGIVSGGGGGRTDAFVARIDYDLSQATIAFLGGSENDEAFDVAVHPGTGKVYVVGRTYGDFPAAGSPVGRGLLSDGFVAKLGEDLSTLEGGRYLGGNGHDAATAIAIEPRTDGIGDLVYVVGWTHSDDLPETAGTPQPAKAGGRSLNDGFAAVLDADLRLLRETYLGGNSRDGARDVAVSPLDHGVWITGDTSYVNADMYAGGFPWVADQATFGGEQDAFVVRLHDRLLDDEMPVARYLGGRRIDSGTALAVDASSGDVYVAGVTTCSDVPDTNLAEFTFPPLPYVPARGVCAAMHDAFLVRLDPDLALVGATLLGGQYHDEAYAVVLHDVGAYLLGRTDSPDLPFTDGAADPEVDARGGGDAFIAWLADDLTAVRQVTYLGGSGQDESLGHGLAIVNDPRSGALQAVVAGETGSDDLPGIPDVAGVVAQRVRGGSLDAFVSRVPADLRAPAFAPDVDVEPAALDLGNVAVGAAIAKAVEIRNLGGAPLHVGADASISGSDAFAVLAEGTCASLAPTVPAAGSCTLYVRFTPPAGGRYEGTLRIASDDPDEPSVAVALTGRSEPDVDLLPADPGHEPAFAFPDTAVGARYEAFFTIQNLGVAPLSVTQVNHGGVAPTPAGLFTLRFGSSPLCPEPSVATPLVLSPGQSCGVGISVAPTAAVGFEGVAFVWSDDPDESPAFMHFSGFGVAAAQAPDLVADVALDFGEVVAGASKTHWALVSNTGGTMLQLRGYSLSDPARFTVDPTGGAVPCASALAGVAPGAYCTVAVTFAPAAADPAVSETLAVRSNDPAEPEHTVRLTGRAVSGEPPPPPSGGGGGGGGGCASGSGSPAPGAGLVAVILVLATWRRASHARRFVAPARSRSAGRRGP